jgi:16S rRNA (cytosine967-C5)-methyltransferase
MVARSARRLGLSGIRTLKRDVSKDLDDLPGLSALPDPGTPSQEGSGAGAAGPALFDRALADVPCSGLGTLRRNPDARWRARPEAILELAYLQLAILEHVARVLKPRGTLVYSTCTLVPEENEEVVAAFLNRNRDYDLVPRSALPAELADVVSEEGFLRCLPHLHDTDGFFAARFERSR